MKKKICIVNPNTTASMTKVIDLTAKKYAGANTEIVTTQPKVGPESIEGYYDEAFSIPGLVEEVFKNNFGLLLPPLNISTKLTIIPIINIAIASKIIPTNCQPD